MRSRLLVPIVMLTLLAARLALAADDAKPIARYVDAHTFAVLVVELEKLDAPALLAWHAEYSGIIEPDAKEREAATQQLTKFVNEWAAHVKMFRDAGATLAYALARDGGAAAVPDVAIVVPVGAGKNAAGVERLLREWSGPPDQVTTGIIDGAVVSAQKARFEALAAKPAGAAAPADLTAALAAHPAAAARVIILPAGQQLFEADPGSWAGMVKNAIQQMDWAVLALDWPPKPAVTLTVSAKDDAAARSVSEALSNALANLKQTKEVSEGLPGGARLLDMLTPEVKGKQVIAGLSSAEVEKLVREEVPAALAKAKEQARRVASMSNVRQLAIGVIMYANDNRGRFPAELAETMKYVRNEAVYRNPRDPQRKDGYVYVKSPVARIMQVKRPSEAVIIYEAHDQWKDGIAVGFLDGHVEWITDKARFDELLKTAQNPPAAQQP